MKDGDVDIQSGNSKGNQKGSPQRRDNIRDFPSLDLGSGLLPRYGSLLPDQFLQDILVEP